MAFYPCSNSVLTDTYSIVRNGIFDMGETHKNRYVNANVLPAGGMSHIYNGIIYRTNGTPSITFNAANNCLYVVKFEVVSPSWQTGWGNGAQMVFGGSARYWNGTSYYQTNCGSSVSVQDAAYTGHVAGYVIGNGSNVTVSWPIAWGYYKRGLIDLYQINW